MHEVLHVGVKLGALQQGGQFHMTCMSVSTQGLLLNPTRPSKGDFIGEHRLLEFCIDVLGDLPSSSQEIKVFLEPVSNEDQRIGRRVLRFLRFL